MFQLPKRTHLVHKAIEPRKLSAAIAAVVEERTDDLWEVKYDGCCGILIKANGVACAFSRPGEPMAGALDRQLRALEALTEDNIVVFVEGWHPNLPFNIINGDFRRGYADDEPRHLIAVMFDVISLDQFMKGRSPEAFVSRNVHLAELQVELQGAGFGSLFRLAHQAENKQDCIDHVHAARARGEVFAIDGYMRKARRDGWVAGAGSEGSVLKDKALLVVDLLVTGLVEGLGKFAGTLGAYACLYKGKAQKVGGGALTNAERDAIWADHHRAEGGIGSIIEVHALAESSNGLLREPRFARFRPDKTEGE